jgi:hypothetical protein
VTNGGRLRFTDDDNPDDTNEVAYETDRVTFVNVKPEGDVHNRLTNIGDAPYRNLVVELKQPDKGGESR